MLSKKWLLQDQDESIFSAKDLKQNLLPRLHLHQCNCHLLSSHGSICAACVGAPHGRVVLLLFALKLIDVTASSAPAHPRAHQHLTIRSLRFTSLYIYHWRSHSLAQCLSSSTSAPQLCLLCSPDSRKGRGARLGKMTIHHLNLMTSPPLLDQHCGMEGHLETKCWTQDTEVLSKLGYQPQVCTFPPCGKTGHSEDTCWMRYPSLASVKATRLCQKATVHLVLGQLNSARKVITEAKKTFNAKAVRDAYNAIMALPKGSCSWCKKKGHVLEDC